MKLKALFKAAVAATKTHSPAILMVSGIGLGIATIVTACKQTTKLSDILEESNEEIAQIDQAEAHPEDMSFKDGSEYTPEDAKRDRKIIKRHTAMKIAKNYAIPALLGVSSVLCILGGYKILHDRNVALTTSFNAVTAAFAKYRERVIAEQGEVMDRHFRYGTKINKVVKKDPETGEETVSYEEELSCPEAANECLNPNLCWDFAASTSPEFRREWGLRQENVSFLKDTETWAKSVVRTRGYLLAYEICQVLNLETNKDAYNWGWMRPETDEEKMKWPEVSIGINEFLKQLTAEGVNGHDIFHRDAFPVYMNAMDLTSNPVFHTRYRPYAAMCTPGLKTVTGKPKHIFAAYPFNRMRKKGIA